MPQETPADEYLAILQQTREHLTYLHELGVERLEFSDRDTDVKTSAPHRIEASTSRPQESESDASWITPSSIPSRATLFGEKLFPVATLPDSSESFEDIWADIGNCVRCQLCEKRTHIVHTEGNRRARLMFVGEAPGADEDAQARPFVGRAGQLLTKIIEAIGFKRDEVLIGNVNRCRPPGNRPPTEEEASMCKPFLLREIAAVRPEVIVVLGNTATRNLLNTKVGITRLRGEFQDYHGVKVMPTFHPAYLLRDPSKKQETWQDLKKVRDYLETTKSR